MFHTSGSRGIPCLWRHASSALVTFLILVTKCLAGGTQQRKALPSLTGCCGDAGRREGEGMVARVRDSWSRCPQAGSSQRWMLVLSLLLLAVQSHMVLPTFRVGLSLF